MDIKRALTSRVSSTKLTEPGPSEEQLELIFQAAFRAPDHAHLKPWRFLTIFGEARHHLGDLIAQVALSDQSDLSEDAIKRYRGLAFRAPYLIALICVAKDHAKVPKIEQQLSLGAAAQNILHAAHAQSLGAIWRTGAISYHSKLALGLGLNSNEELLGFIYLGTPLGSRKKLPEVRTSDFVTNWC